MDVNAIVYTSATGFTRRYAQLLAQTTGLPAYALSDPAGPPAGTKVLYLGWLRAGAVRGLKGARGRWTPAAVCAVGMAPPEGVDAEGLARRNGLEGAPLFYLRGGYAPERVKGLSRAMMAVMTRSVRRSAAKGDPQAEAMLPVLLHGADWVDRENLRPVLDWLGTE